MVHSPQSKALWWSEHKQRPFLGLARRSSLFPQGMICAAVRSWGTRLLQTQQLIPYEASTASLKNLWCNLTLTSRAASLGPVRTSSNLNKYSPVRFDFLLNGLSCVLARNRSAANSLSMESFSQLWLNSSQIKRSALLARERPLIPLVRNAVSKEPKLPSFIATAAGDLSIRWATCITEGLVAFVLEKGILQYKLNVTSSWSRVQLSAKAGIPH